MYERAENELGFWCASRDATLGVSGTGFEGGAASVWDAARANREHLSRWWNDRPNVEMERKIAPLFAALGGDAQQVALAAWSTCSAGFHVSRHFMSQHFQAPLIGLGLLVWGDVKPDDRRAPYALIEAWERILLASPSALGQVKKRAIDLYEPVLRRYEVLRIARDDADGTSRRARAEARRRRNEAFLAELKEASR